jgi:IS30 family transposase
MGNQYSRLNNSERNRLQRSLNQCMSLRAIARALGRSLSTLSRECRRGGSRLDYYAVEGGAWECSTAAVGHASARPVVHWRSL